MFEQAITYAGHSAVFVECAGLKVAIDPWLKGNPVCPQSLLHPGHLDLIVLTHGHADHAGDAVRVSHESGARIAATFELGTIMVNEGVAPDRVISLNKGGSTQISNQAGGSITVQLTHAFHSNSYHSHKHGTQYAGEACGVILSGDSWCVYHAGDTALFGDMRLIGETQKPDVALLPIGDHFTMGPIDAAHAASMLGCTYAIPIHYRTFDLLTGTYPAFASACAARGIESIELQPGERRNFRC